MELQQNKISIEFVVKCIPHVINTQSQYVKFDWQRSNKISQHRLKDIMKMNY